jgi:hypothetical protein
MKTISLAAVLASAAAAPSGEYWTQGWCANWKQLPDQNRAGYKAEFGRTFLHEPKDSEECRQACLAHPDCTHATYEKDGPWGKECWLGSGLSEKIHRNSRGINSRHAKNWYEKKLSQENIDDKSILEKTRTIDFCYHREPAKKVVDERVHIELGSFRGNNLLTHDPKPVTFGSEFDAKPSIFGGVLSAFGGDPAIPMFQQITKAGAKASVDEPQCFDGAHPAAETLDFMALENGDYNTDEGRLFIVGSAPSNVGKVEHDPNDEDWVKVNYHGRFEKDVVVVVTAQSDVQTVDDQKWYNIRVRNVNKDSFEFHVENQHGNVQAGHKNSHEVREAVQVAYMVIEEGQGHINHHKYNALTFHRTANSVTEKQVKVADSTTAPLLAKTDPYQGEPLIFASISHFGIDTAGFRLTARNGGAKKDQIWLKVQEPATGGAGKCGWDNVHPGAEDAYLFIIADEHGCEPKRCNDWECSEWCKCFHEADEALYQEQGCTTAEDEFECDCGMA